jgi:hypothetical protein
MRIKCGDSTYLLARATRPRTIHPPRGGFGPCISPMIGDVLNALCFPYKFSPHNTYVYMCGLKGMEKGIDDIMVSLVAKDGNLRVSLVHCNGYYTVIRISITRNKRSCNVITIIIYLFRDNT